MISAKTVKNESMLFVRRSTVYIKKQTNNKKDVVQKKKKTINQTGIPDDMKEKFERASGFSFDDVRIHYNSEKPALLDSYAYTQGNHVYVAAGQEKYLSHELTHVVQQKQGRVLPTKKQYGFFINDDPTLEREADTMQYNVSEIKEKSAQTLRQKSMGIPLIEKTTNGFYIQKMSVQNTAGAHYRMKQVKWILDRIVQLDTALSGDTSLSDLIKDYKTDTLEKQECAVLLKSFKAEFGEDVTLDKIKAEKDLNQYVKIDTVTIGQQRSLPKYVVGPDDYKIDTLHCIAGKANEKGYKKLGPHIALAVKSDCIYVAVNTNKDIKSNRIDDKFKEPITAVSDTIKSFNESDIKKYNEEFSGCSEFLKDITKYPQYKKSILDYVTILKEKKIMRVYNTKMTPPSEHTSSVEYARKANDKIDANDKTIHTKDKAMHGEILIADYLQKQFDNALANVSKDAEKAKAREAVFGAEDVFRSIRIGGTKINCHGCKKQLDGTIKELYDTKKARIITSAIFNETDYSGYQPIYTDGELSETDHLIKEKKYEDAGDKYLSMGNKTAANKAYRLAMDIIQDEEVLKRIRRKAEIPDES